MSLREHNKEVKRKNELKVKSGISTSRHISTTISQNNSDYLKRGAHLLQTFNKHHAALYKNLPNRIIIRTEQIEQEPRKPSSQDISSTQPLLLSCEDERPNERDWSRQSGPRLQRRSFTHLLINTK